LELPVTFLVEQQSHGDLISGFFAASRRFPDNTALVFPHRSVTYQALYDTCVSLASLLAGLESEMGLGNFSGILSKRGELAFQAVLASFMRGKAYVPFNLNEQPEVLLKAFAAINCRLFFVDVSGLDVLCKLFSSMPASVFIFDDACEVPDALLKSQHHCVVFREKEIETLADCIKPIEVNSLAYVLFTSGSTGEPKAVPISHSNAVTYVKELLALYPLNEHDRCSQAFEFSFDPSVHDMFVSWFAGASLYVMDERARLGAHYVIKKHQLTVWNTIPSLVKMCLAMRSFNENNLASLKYIFLNGESVQQSMVMGLQEIIPQAKIVSLYGLTETTVNLAHYCWQTGRSELDCRDGLLPIGDFFPGVSYLDQGDESQELCLAGKQIFSGYLETRDEIRERNRSLFISREGLSYLKTGDIFLKDERGVLHIVGRRDEQVKIKGHRVDVNKVRQLLEQESQCMDALVLVMGDEEGHKILVGFLKGEGYDTQYIQSAMAEVLPAHECLQKILILEDYPYLVSGKVDRVALRALVKSGSL